MRPGSTQSFGSTCLALLLLCVIKSQGFLSSPPRLSTDAATSATPAGHQRCGVPRMALTPPRKPSNGASAGSAAAGGDDSGPTSRFGGADDILKTTSSMTRAPLRITPNIQPRDERRPKAEADRDMAYGAFLTEESLEIAAMAWEEFSDFLRRTVERNVNGAQFEFDIRQWSSSIRKWWSRAVEMDVQAKADLLRLYYSSVGQRDAWGNHATKVDDRVEDEWDSIYVDCQDTSDVDTQDYSFQRSSSDTSFSSVSAGVEGAALGSGGPRSASGSATAAGTELPSQSRGEGRRGRTSSGVSKTGGSRSALMAAMDAFQAEEEEGPGRSAGGVSKEKEEEEEEDDGDEDDEEGGSKVFDEDEIIDCAIRGRWTFTNNDDPPHFLPQ